MNKATELIVLKENGVSETIQTLEGILYDIPCSTAIQRFVIEIDNLWYNPVDAADIIKENRIIRLIYLELIGPREFSLH